MDQLHEHVWSLLEGIRPQERLLVLTTLAAKTAAEIASQPQPVTETKPADTQPSFYTCAEAAAVLRCTKKVVRRLTVGTRFRKRVGKELRFEKRGFDLWASARLN